MDYISLAYGLVLFMLCMIALILSKHNTTWYFAPHLSLLASFSILHGLAVFIEKQRLNNPVEGLTWISFFLLLTSFLPLLEFARRTWNNSFTSARLSAPWMFGTASLVVALFLSMPWAPITVQVKALRLFVAALAILLIGIALFATRRTKEKKYITGRNAFGLLILGLVLVCYSLSFFLLYLTDSLLPTQENLLSLFGVSIQSLRTVCTVVASMGLVSLVLLAGENCQMEAIAFGWSQKAIVITDADNVILRVNNAFIESTGYTSEDVVGHKISLLNSRDQNDPFYVEMWESVKRTGIWQGEISDRRKNGEIYPLWLTITGVKDVAGAISYYVCMYTDITERKAIEEDMKRRAFYDPLTLLPNRFLLHERLKHCLDVERRSGKSLALLMLDLDRFKLVNDSLGHMAGDELLQQVAARITKRLREVDMVARLGGDEFIVLLEDISCPQDASRVAEDIISDLSKPFKLNQSKDVWIGASIGISLYHQHGDSPEILMDHADKALYQAKDQGRGCFAYFSESLTTAARERIELETRLRRAIQQGELRVFYQPQIDIKSGRIVGAEALVRWQDPIEGLISPGLFIPVAEESNLIMEIGEFVLRETCNQGQFWLAYGIPPLSLAVNISPHQLKRIDISDLIARILVETGFPAKHLELEITESGIMENQDNAMAILNSLRAQGIRLAIDDFGTGYSSLAYLKSFPLNVLKIDKSFIDDIPHSKDGMEIAATIIAMGRTLGLKVLAEGVETSEQLAFLHGNNCDIYQGFIKSCPLSAKEFGTLLRNQHRRE